MLANSSRHSGSMLVLRRALTPSSWEPLRQPCVVTRIPLRPPSARDCERRNVAIPSGIAVSGVRSTPDLWALVEYNAHYFNSHRMASLLKQLLEEPREEARADPRLTAYLKRAQASVKLWENIKDVTAKDLAAAIVAARELGHMEAEEFSDVLVDTIAEQVRKLSVQRVSFFVTNFAKQGITDRPFWRAAASKVAGTDETVAPQVLVSLFDAFRKSGVRSQKFYSSLARRVYYVLEDLPAGHIPPIIATLCRVPMPAEERERAVRALLVRWLSMLRQEREHPTDTIAISQILSLTVSLGLAPEEINVAVFARDVSTFIGERIEVIHAEDLIVFLWALQRLVPSGSLTKFFANGLRQVGRVWDGLRAGAQLSVQRLTQISDVLVAAREDGSWDSDLAKLQDNILQDLSESVQHCSPEALAELLEIWAGNEAFWRHYRDFAEAVVKRLEELLLESDSLEQMLPVLQAVLSVPGLYASLPGLARDVLRKAVQSRGPDDVERVRAIFGGSRWEAICEAESGHNNDVTGKMGEHEQISSTLPTTDDVFGGLLASWNPPIANLRLLDFLETAVKHSPNPDEALQALEVAAPFAQRLAGDVTGDVGVLLEQVVDQVVSGHNSLSPLRIAGALRACAIAGLPHTPLFLASLPRLAELKPLDFVEALEAYAALRLAIPELQLWFDHLIAKGVDRRLPAAAISRLIAAASRLALLDADSAERLLTRLITVASPMRPPSLETVTTLCNGLSLLEGMPQAADLWQVVAWIARFEGTSKTVPQVNALRQFAFKALVDPESRHIINCFQPELQRSLAAVLCEPSVRRNVATDTTLKFMHEVAEVLRNAGRSYDLEIYLGSGLFADLALPGPTNILWLIDGPEAFHRPFEPGGMRLVPAELRRMELLTGLLGSCDVMRETVERWGDGGSAGGIGPIFIGSPSSHELLRHPGNCSLKRLSWLDWAALPEDERLSALAPFSAPLVAPTSQRQSTSATMVSHTR